MKGKYILFTALMMAMPISMDAQKKRSAPKTKAKPTVVDKEFELRLDGMRAATQKVMFVDSVVVSKSRLLKSLNIPDEAGSIVDYNTFFKETDQPNAVVYLNQLKNKCVFSKYVNKGWDLYSSELIGGKWAKAIPLKGLDVIGDDVDINWPFLLSDGVTLYFAAKGEESIGGFDIFMTRYDESTDRYLKPENIGMPFNSTANDYFYIVDEYDGYGWFATDRNQPEGKACIYTFIPTELRETYDSSIDYKVLSSYARINAISATWGDGTERDKALKRLQTAISRSENEEKVSASRLSFVINDNVVYHSPTQFRAEGNASRFNTLCEMKEKISELTTRLDTDRNYYAKANESDRATLRQEILSLETELEKLQQESNNLEKDIRNAENKKILR